MFEKLKRFGRNFTQTTPFILSNTVIFIPYLLFLGLTDSHNWLTILPFTLFYAFRMTGLFLVNSLRFGLDSYTLLMIALLIGGAGSLLGILGVFYFPLFYFPLFYFSSVLLGLSAAWLVPANTTVNFHEKTQGFINMDGKKYLFAAIWLFLLYQAIELPAPTQIAASFTIYTLFYVMAYHTVSHYPRYELDFKDIKRNLVATRELVLFLIFFGLLFLLRNARLLFDERLFDLAIYGFLLLFILFVFVLGHQKKEWKLPSWLNLFTFLNGMLGNFLFLFSSFYVGILYGLEKLSIFMYLPYAAGLIAAKIVGPWILKRLTWSPLAMQLLGLSSSLLVLLIPNGFAIGVFLLSFWHVVTGSWLNKEYYQTDTAIPMDRRIVVKKKEWKLPSWLNLFTFLNGMLGNFLFLFSSFYVGILYGLEKLPFYMYLPYAAGLIAAKIVGPLILKRLSWSPLATQLLGLSSSLLVLLIPNGFAIGVFLLSFWHVVTGSWLNKEYYQTDTAIPMDRRIVVKYTTQNKGSVIHQFLLMTLLFVLAKEMGEPIHLLLITLNHESVPIESVQLLILAKWINVGLLLSGLVTVYHLWKKAKKNEAIH